MTGDTTYMDYPRPVPIKVELNLNGALTRTILEYKWLILTQVLLSAMLRAILSHDLFSHPYSKFKMLGENQRKITLAILMLKNFDKARIERIIVVSAVFAAAEIGLLIWHYLLPRRPLYMGLLQLLVTTILKYAFIGDDGIAAYFGQYNISLSTFTDEMSPEFRENICDFGIAFYIILGLIGYACSRTKTKMEKEINAMHKFAMAEFDWLASIIEVGIWLTIVCFSMYDLETNCFEYLMRLRLACFISFSFEAGFVSDMIAFRYK